MLLERIKNDSLKARKESDSYSKSMLITLFGELETSAKRSGNEIMDQDALSLIKSYIKNNNKAIEELKSKNSDVYAIASIEKDNKFWENYLPLQMSESELNSVIEKQINAGENIGGVMAYLKKNYNAQYDASMASKIVRNMLNK